jgi:hypothetical protein
MGFGTNSEPPHAGRSLPLISVLAGLARSSHWIVAEALVGPEANERQSNHAVPFGMGAPRHCGCCRRCRC